ncbi:hypothetical protein BDY19DRAFT_880415 [Irpex rosettiformis]|uniref:Uncharacterized protein n=1 Tax=Irpex rosettiformis TaxID=378272 RepID=A0ACB8UJN0_9APHY|nr:hypothetical protein BDY19DRAFT_880415 [Irpex rosettiformis]
MPLLLRQTPRTSVLSSGLTANVDSGLEQLCALPSCIPTLPPPSSPETPLARTLVLCFDGTGDQFDADNSNVVQLFSMLKKDDRKQQMVYYQAGIGTYTAPRFATPSTAKVSKLLDEAIAWNLHAHVKDGYEFLMQNYEAGDKICIFGFSRGAYTARALAGMVHKVGLLPACNHQQVSFAYKMYTDKSRVGWEQSTAFKKTFSMDVDVEFIGVWDTVSSVGLIGKRLPFTTSNTCVRYFRHAISLDERRAKFRQNSWNYPSEKEKGLGVQEGEMPKAGLDIQSKPLERVEEPASEQKRVKVRMVIDAESSPDQDEMEQRFSRLDPQPDKETDVLEVWFAGCHCDVGGGSVPNDTRHNLARIPLRWMIRQCFLANTGIRFHSELLRNIGIDPDSLYPVVKPRPPPMYATPSDVRKEEKDNTKAASRAGTLNTLTEEEEDLEDALSPLYDQLLKKKWWWLLEMWPVRHRVQREDDSWKREITMNLGKGRNAVQQGRNEILVHRSVKIRMEAHASQVGGSQGKKYVPKASLEGVEPTWVD